MLEYIALATAAVYWPALGNEFVAYDDDLYITQEPALREGLTPESVRWALTSHDGGNWFPLTRLSWLLDASLHGVDARGFHATSVWLHALASGVLYAAGVYLMLRRRLAQLAIGIGLLSNGTNLLVFTAGGLTRARPPVVPEGAERLVPPYADPVPQALVLTAIVIGFGLLAFSLVLAHRVHATVGTDDVDEVGRER